MPSISRIFIAYLNTYGKEVTEFWAKKRILIGPCVKNREKSGDYEFRKKNSKFVGPLWEKIIEVDILFTFKPCRVTYSTNGLDENVP